jgi:hypothetical protein
MWVRYSDHAAALAAERAKFAAFADENGEPRKVLGTLPVTADGFVIGESTLYGCHEYFVLEPGGLIYPTYTPPRDGIRKVFATKQAAEAAAGGKK